ncbi:alpha/beta hydrolase family protein [Glaciecola sp. 1036]|uniref:alpha/beta hydrolase family protein n=1 Tax=Alteromonadaceae TaxID=72275 RepID=UPI003D05A9CC
MKISISIIFLFITTCVFGDEFDSEEITFISHKEKLSGTIVFPKNGEIRSAVVFVHGSGKQKRNMHWATRFASDGVAALVYDKRGAGRSGGNYESQQSVGEKNLQLLADDAIAALNVLRDHPRTKTLPLGLTGISQAGWIVPLAAEKSAEVDFLVLWSGPVCKVSEEDIFSKYTSDWDQENVPSFKEALSARHQRYIWPDFLGKDTDSSENLATLDIAGLWIFGGKDGSIPVDLSISKLNKLIESGHKYEYILYSNQGHNNMEATFSSATNWINNFANKH